MTAGLGVSKKTESGDKVFSEWEKMTGRGRWKLHPQVEDFRFGFGE